MRETETMNRHYDESPLRKVEGVILKRGQLYWQAERLPIHGCRIVDNTGRIVAADVYDEELAEQIVAEHNQHAALVAERERLRAAIKTALDKVFNDGKRKGWVEIQQSAIDQLYAVIGELRCAGCQAVIDPEVDFAWPEQPGR